MGYGTYGLSGGIIILVRQYLRPSVNVITYQNIFLRYVCKHPVFVYRRDRPSPSWRKFGEIRGSALGWAGFAVWISVH